jgi:hypothetical protein
MKERKGFEAQTAVPGAAPAVPEASTWLLFGLGLAALAGWRRRRQSDKVTR